MDNDFEPRPTGWMGGQHLIVFAPPKSASTFCGNCLSEYFRLEMASYEDEISGPNDISINRAFQLSAKNLIIKSHSVANEKSMRIIQNNKIPPILMKRNVLDTIMSMRDHKLRHDSLEFNRLVGEMELEDQLRIWSSEWLNWYFKYYYS